MRITVTELNKRPSLDLNELVKGPIIVEKTGRLAVARFFYEQFRKLEDAYWGKQAIIAEKEKSIGTKKTLEFLGK